MKKILVLVALATMVSASAFASDIATTAHNLAGAGSGVDEICAYCHTPHNGGTEAPLWNRGAGATGITYYNSASMDSTGGSAVTNDAPLCLSCHDSATLTSTNLTNVPNGKTYTPGSLSGAVSGNADLGVDLTNDHPVGMTLASSGAEINTAPVGVGLFGAGDDVWCSSCHDVHDNTNAPFLIMSNTNSALCLACHNK